MVNGHLSISHQDNQLGFIVGQEICCYNNVGLVLRRELCRANTWCCAASCLHPRSCSAMAPSHLHLNTSVNTRSTNTQPVKTKITPNKHWFEGPLHLLSVFLIKEAPHRASQKNQKVLIEIFWSQQNTLLLSQQITKLLGLGENQNLIGEFLSNKVRVQSLIV